MENLIGNTYGRLTVISPAEKKVLPSGAKIAMWLCKCSCGNTKAVSAYNLKIGKTKSCGCLNSELSRERRLKHSGTLNGTRERLYDIWRAMKERCNNPKNISYHNYGGRGVRVCDFWENDYPCFKSWAIENGYSDEMSIDRIDVSGNYEPSNCRWATRKQQNNNTRHNTFISAFGKTLTLSQWSEETGISTDLISARIKRLHWSPEDALSRPVRPKK